MKLVLGRVAFGLVCIFFLQYACTCDEYGYKPHTDSIRFWSILVFLFLFFIAPSWAVAELDNYYENQKD